MNVLSLFDGISCGRIALERAGIPVEKYFASEIELQPIQISKMNWPDIIQLGDVTAWEAWIKRLPKIDLLIGGSPCFVAGTKVICKSGIKNIEDIIVGDECLSHDGKYHKVSAIGNEFKEIYKLKVSGIRPIETTEKHPFYVSSMKRIKGKRTFSEPYKKFAYELQKDDFLGIPIITKEENIYDLTPEECFILGRYIADGHTRKDFKNDGRKNPTRNYQLIISVGKQKLEKFKQYFSENHFSCLKHTQNTYRCIFSNKRLVELAEKLCGIGAENKHFGLELINLPKDLLEEVLNGYLSGDGYETNNSTDKTEWFGTSTISKSLVDSLILVVAKLYNNVCNVSYSKLPDKKQMYDGRIINQKSFWTVRFSKQRTKQANSYFDIERNMIWTRFKNLEKQQLMQRVFNITVEDTHTYTSNCIVCFNCQDISLLGRQKGLTEGSGTRSSLFHTMKSIYFWILKNNNPNCHILLENVFTKPQWEKAITDELKLSERMGYDYHPIKINSSLVSAQLRPRNYWSSWQTTVPEDKKIYLQDILEHGYAYQKKSNALLKSYTGSSIIHTFKYKVNTLVAEKAQPDFNNHHNNKSTRSFKVENGYVEIPVLNARKSIGTREFEKYYFPVEIENGWYTFREFTAREMERLQTLPDNYCKNVPLKWVQEATGNGWTVDVITHLFKDLLKQHPEFLQPLH